MPSRSLSLRPLPATLTVRSRRLRCVAIGLASTVLVVCVLLHFTVARADWLAVDELGWMLDLSGETGVPRWFFVCLAAVLLSMITVALGGRFGAVTRSSVLCAFRCALHNAG